MARAGGGRLEFARLSAKREPSGDYGVCGYGKGSLERMMRALSKTGVTAARACASESQPVFLLSVALEYRSVASPPIPLAWREGQLCVPIALMGGKPTWFLLDTGSDRSYLTRKAYSRLLAAGAAVKEDGTLIASAASLGDYPVPSLEFAREENAFQYTVDGAADGYLGMDFLSKYRVGLDLREKTLRLWPSETDEGAAVREWFTTTDLWTVPILLRSEGYCVPVDVGNLTVPMVIDTGCPDTYVHSEVAECLRGAKKRKETEDRAFYNGRYKVRTYSVRPFVLGGASLGQRKVRAAGVDRMVGLLGRDVLAPLKAFIDYPGGKAYFAGTRDEDGVSLPVWDGPDVTLPNGVVVHWPRDVVVKVPPGGTFLPTAEYTVVFKKDASYELIPKKSGRMSLTALR